MDGPGRPRVGRRGAPGRGARAVVKKTGRPAYVAGLSRSGRGFASRRHDAILWKNGAIIIYISSNYAKYKRVCRNTYTKDREIILLTEATGFVITPSEYEPCRRPAAGSQGGVIDATGVAARQGLQPANGRFPVVAIWARSSACLCVGRVSAAKKSASLSTLRSIAWPELSGAPRFRVIDRLPFSAETRADSKIEPASAH